jgi:P2 family phage contractile tail tube protein
MFIPAAGPILATTVRIGGNVMAEDAKVSLPEVSALTSEYAAMGTLELPVTGQIENMELSITKTGLDKQLAQLGMLGKQVIEIRGAFDVVEPVGGTKSVKGFKATCDAFATAFPGLEVEKGSVAENECKFTVTRYELIVDGAEAIYIDRLSYIFRINGVDYSSNITSLL